MDTLTAFLGSRGKAGTLRILFGIAAEELHVREIARRAGVNEATIRQELRRMEKLGLVEARRKGNRLYYRASTAHPLYPELRNLVLKTVGLVELLREVLRGHRIGVAFVFGSLATESGGPESDVDLMVIGEIGLREISPLLSGPATALGREINPHVMTRGEFQRRRLGRDHFVQTILAQPKLFVIGNEHELTTLG